MKWSFFKTYTVKCPDGTVKTVYRNVDDAFPFFIPGWKAKLKIAGKALEEVIGELKTEYSTAIQGLLFGLDDFNNGLMMTFRGAYIVYKNDPCKHGMFFEREVSKLLDDQSRIRTLKLQIDGLITLASLQSSNSSEITKTISKIVDQMGSLSLPELTRNRVVEARKITKEMIEEIDEQ